MKKVKCPICGKEIDDDPYNECPYCLGGYTGDENLYEEDEKDDYNLISRKEAKNNIAKGLSVFGDPLPKK